MSETKFPTHTEPQAKLSSCTFSFLCFLTADEKTEGSGLNSLTHIIKVPDWLLIFNQLNLPEHGMKDSKVRENKRL
jgi:hypothetical protein